MATPATQTAPETKAAPGTPAAAANQQRVTIEREEAGYQNRVAHDTASGEAGLGSPGFLLFTEMAAPRVPAANQARIWVQDNGSGKTQLMIQFATGAAIQIAIQV